MAVQVKAKTFLSPNVRHLLVEIGEAYQEVKEDCNIKLFLTENLTFDWKNIATLFGELPEDFNIHLQSVEWFEDIIHKLWPVFAAAHLVLLCPTYDTSHLWKMCAWTRKELEMKTYFDLFLNLKVSTTEAILFLSSVLERSLGNIFLLKGHNVPSLLRDLLAMPELSSIIGSVPILFLQILMGTPLALNLRNVVWHGFPCTDELPPQFASTLFLITASVGELLFARDITLHAIPVRPQICFPSDVFEGCFPDVNNYSNEVLQMLTSSPFIDASHYTYWETGLKHFMDSKFGTCLLLLLPQFEHMLRSIFCSSNKCPERMLTAESTALYITLSEIMAEDLSSKEGVKSNIVRFVLGDIGLEMLQDLFMHQSGPRIRDRLSHGECDLEAVPKTLTNQVICVALIMTLKAESGLTTIQTCADNRPHLLKDQLMLAYQTYISRFHQSSMVQTSIISEVHALNQWQTYPRPDQNREWESKASDEIELPLLQRRLLDIMYDSESKTDVVYTEMICEYLSSVKIQTVFRPKTENEVLTILRHIIDNIKLISVQVKQHLQHKFELHSRHEMRSRQRDSYQRMLNVLPFLNQVISCVLLILAIQLCKINSVDVLPCKRFQQKLKFLKHILQFIENVTSCTTLERNRWEETSVLAQKFIQSENQVFCTHIIL